MSVSKRRLSFFWMAALIVTGAVGAMLLGGLASGSQVQAASQARGDVQVDIIVVGSKVKDVVRSIEGRSDGQFQIDSFFDISYVSNIGSSGEDGVRATSFTVDSFFDVTYEMGREGCSGCWQTEMVSMQLVGSVPGGTNPGDALDEIVEAIGSGKIAYGHVTVLM